MEEEALVGVAAAIAFGLPFIILLLAGGSIGVAFLGTLLALPVSGPLGVLVAGIIGYYRIRP